ncbi:MAG TPA: c-type cytochrome [Oleiagrimonas sp.]|nr:c-type cytochrome [Oleiagrimonas sp.]
MKRHLLPVLAACVLALPAMAAQPEHTQAPTRPSRLGMCAACHGERGIAVVPGVPNLAGQRLDYLLHALKQYRDGERDVAVMRAAVGPLSQQQLEQLARWFAAQPACAPTDKKGKLP